MNYYASVCPETLTGPDRLMLSTKGDVVLSIVNITMGKERALIGCDTACCYDVPDGKRLGQMSKLLVLQGMGVVMAFRGQRHMFHQIVNRSLFDNEPDCFDSLVDQLPAIINDAKPHYVAFEFESNLELYVVGWSHRFGKITGASYQIDPDGILKASNIDTWRYSVAPEVPEDPLPVLDTHEKMFAHAQRQTAMYKADDPEAVIGGRYFIADVTREQILVSYVGDLSAVSAP